MCSDKDRCSVRTIVRVTYDDKGHRVECVRPMCEPADMEASPEPGCLSCCIAIGVVVVMLLWLCFIVCGV